MLSTAVPCHSESSCHVLLLKLPLRTSSLISCHTLSRWLCHRLHSLVTIVSTLFNARTATCCDLIALRVLCKALHFHARPCAANCEAKHSQHYVRNPCKTLRSEFFKRVILCFLSCEVCHALSCHSLDGTHPQLLCSAWLINRILRRWWCPLIG